MHVKLIINDTILRKEVPAATTAHDKFTCWFTPNLNLMREKESTTLSKATKTVGKIRCLTEEFSLQTECVATFKNQTNMKTRRFSSILMIALFLTIFLNAQDNKTLGLKGTVGSTLGSSSYAVGLDFGHQFSKSWGYDFAVLHKTITALNPVNLHFIHIPVTMKYYTKYVNVGAGFSGDYFIGHAVPAGYTDSSADVDPAFQLGFIAKVSKDILLNKNLIIEPEIYLNPTLYGLFDNYGIGFSLKYVFTN